MKLCPASPTLRTTDIANLEIFDFAAGFEGGHQPARLFSAARPCFEWRLKIAVLRKNGGVFAPRLPSAVPATVAGLGTPGLDDAPAQNCEAILEFTFFRRDSRRQDPANLFV